MFRILAGYTVYCQWRQILEWDIDAAPWLVKPGQSEISGCCTRTPVGMKIPCSPIWSRLNFPRSVLQTYLRSWGLARHHALIDICHNPCSLGITRQYESTMIQIFKLRPLTTPHSQRTHKWMHHWPVIITNASILWNLGSTTERSIYPATTILFVQIPNV